MVISGNSRIAVGGFILMENDFPVAPAILGIVLGPMLEQNFFNSMIKADGNFLGFFTRPVAMGLGVLTLVIWALVLASSVRILLLRSRGSSSPATGIPADITENKS